MGESGQSGPHTPAQAQPSGLTSSSFSGTESGLVVPGRRREWPGPSGDLSAGLVLLSVTRLPNGCQVRGDLSRGPPLCTALGSQASGVSATSSSSPEDAVVQPSTWLGDSVLKSATLVSTPTLSVTQGALPAPGSLPEALRTCETARPSLLSSEHQTWQDSLRLLKGGGGGVFAFSPSSTHDTSPQPGTHMCGFVSAASILAWRGTAQGELGM